ncbi:MAG: hypothetical protein ACRDKA_11575 [Actinomycetota bacterium]
MIEITDWARDILTKAEGAARRFNPDARIRLARVAGAVEATFVEAPLPGDLEVRIGEVALYVEVGLQGLLDVEEPHDRLVLRPAGSAPNVRAAH